MDWDSSEEEGEANRGLVSSSTTLGGSRPGTNKRRAKEQVTQEIASKRWPTNNFQNPHKNVV